MIVVTHFGLQFRDLRIWWWPGNAKPHTRDFLVNEEEPCQAILPSGWLIVGEKCHLVQRRVVLRQRKTCHVIGRSPGWNATPQTCTVIVTGRQLSYPRHPQSAIKENVLPQNFFSPFRTSVEIITCTSASKFSKYNIWCQFLLRIEHFAHCESPTCRLKAVVLWTDASNLGWYTCINRVSSHA